MDVKIFVSRQSSRNKVNFLQSVIRQDFCSKRLCFGQDIRGLSSVGHSHCTGYGL